MIDKVQINSNHLGKTEDRLLLGRPYARDLQAKCSIQHGQREENYFLLDIPIASVHIIDFVTSPLIGWNLVLPLKHHPHPFLYNLPTRLLHLS